jgi:hypothetical protein
MLEINRGCDDDENRKQERKMNDEKADRLKYWKDQITVMHLVQNEVQRYDELGLYEYYYPELAATEEQLVTVEAYIGHSIDNDYRDFLLCANGWKWFTQSVNLFGTGDLEGSALMGRAMETLEILDDEKVLKVTEFTKAELLPIAASFEARDLFVITRPMSREPGVVIWFPGGEIEMYQNFKEYFLAMVDYNRYGIESFKKDIEERKHELEQVTGK